MSKDSRGLENNLLNNIAKQSLLCRHIKESGGNKKKKLVSKVTNLKLCLFLEKQDQGLLTWQKYPVCKGININFHIPQAKKHDNRQQKTKLINVSR